MQERLWKWFVGLIGLFFLLGLLVLLSATPRNDRTWYPELALLPHVSVERDTILVRKARNWYIAPDGLVKEEYVMRRYSVKDIERVWFIVEPFSNWDAVGHTFFSFD